MSQSSESEVHTELQLLSNFLATLKQGSVVQTRGLKLVETLSKELETLKAKNDPWNLKIQININNSVGLRNVSVDKNCTLQDLKLLLETQTSHGISVERIKVKRTDRAWSQLDNRTLIACEIVNGDELVVDCSSKGLKQFDKNITGLGRIENCNYKPAGPFELLMTAIHCFMLDLGFIYMVELASTVPGFAPSLKELPTGTLLPSDVYKNNKSCIFLYKNKKSGKQYTLEGEFDGSSAVNIKFKVKNNNTSVASDVLDMREFISKEALEIEFDAMCTRVLSVIRVVIPDICSPQSSSSAVDSSTAMLCDTLPLPSNNTSFPQGPSANPHFQPRGPSPPPYVPPVAAFPGAATGAGTGRSDLEPFPNVFRPGAQYVPPMMPGGGSLVGPDHPLFGGPPPFGADDRYYPSQDDPNYFFPNGGVSGDPNGLGGFAGSGFGLPQPRFDPFGPVPGPNRGVDIGNPGPLGGRRPRGPAPGEPNPDHMKPPGW